MDEITPNAAANQVRASTTGCTAIMVNQPGNEIIGHNEDTMPETLNHWYILSAHIISNEGGKWGITEERFMSLCYAGYLPGYTMGYNHHGLIFTINTLSAAKLYSGRIRK